MIPGSSLKKYNKKNDYTYSFGAFPTFELLKNRPKDVENILIHSDAKEEIKKKIEVECKKLGIEILQNDRIIERIRDKDSCILIGVLKKYKSNLEQGKHHVVLVNPSDTGNMGTIIRSCVGFGIHDLAIIEPAVDVFNPKTIRSSMGALFHIHFQFFSSFKEYQDEYNAEREYYPFMLNGVYQLGTFKPQTDQAFSLIFGNESSGLDDSYLNIGKSVSISHSKEIDSLNLSLATGIGIYEFTKQNNGL